uniref:Reticulophagy regulator 1 n=1 Tax=Neogobius melanostomus TaxID=47308 RepID=A0A8C6UVM7_9GOBI
QRAEGESLQYYFKKPVADSLPSNNKLRVHPDIAVRTLYSVPRWSPPNMCSDCVPVCLLVCSVCTFFAVLGRYIPGVVISYALVSNVCNCALCLCAALCPVLGIFLWPLLSSVDLEPFLQKMDLGLVNFLHRIKENHIERSLSSVNCPMFGRHSHPCVPVQVDLSQCQELCVSDTEVSDISWTEGAFTLSEGHTPFSEGDTPSQREFPSLDNGSITNDSSDEDNLYLAAPAPDPSVADTICLSELGGQLVSAVIQQRMESALGLSGSSLGLCTGRLEDSDSEVEDFELLDQSELEQCETELGLVQQETEKSPEPSGRHAVHGFISRLLKRQ